MPPRSSDSIPREYEHEVEPRRVGSLKTISKTRKKVDETMNRMRAFNKEHKITWANEEKMRNLVEIEFGIGSYQIRPLDHVPKNFDEFGSGTLWDLYKLSRMDVKNNSRPDGYQSGLEFDILKEYYDTHGNTFPTEEEFLEMLYEAGVRWGGSRWKSKRKKESSSKSDII